MPSILKNGPLERILKLLKHTNAAHVTCTNEDTCAQSNSVLKNEHFVNLLLSCFQPRFPVFGGAQKNITEHQSTVFHNDVLSSKNDKKHHKSTLKAVYMTCALYS